MNHINRGPIFKIRIQPMGAILWLWICFLSTNLLAQQGGQGNRQGGQGFGQQRQQMQQRVKKETPAAAMVREVSGIVRDVEGNEIPGASVALTSDKDTLKMSTNEDGIFVFSNVKSATYTLVVKSIGFNATPPMRFRQNDAIPRIVMDPIILREESNNIGEVVINGTPSVTYKTDTVEYKASDYIVREGSTVDELLKKMEGMEVGTDGSVKHQGQDVVKAKLNGKDYLGGDIANAIKNLPAEIVEKIQVVDDYGDQAARTGIKDGDPQKVLNITTKASKSVGNTANLSSGLGNNDRFESGIFATRINGNQTIGLNARLNNTVNGIGSSANGGGNTFTVGGGNGGGRNGGGGGGGGNGGNSSSGGSGTSNLANGSLSYRDNLGKKIELTANYSFNNSNVNSLNSSISQNFSSLGVTNALRGNSALNKSQAHNIRVELEYNIDAKNFLRFIPTLNVNTSNATTADSVFQTGLIHQDQVSANKNSNTRPQFGFSLFFDHRFDKARRYFSVQSDLNANNQEAEQERDSRILYFLDATQTIAKDSLINRIIARKNLQNTYRGSITFVEPITATTQIELNAQLNRNGYDNNATTQNVNAFGASQVIDSLSNIYNYSFTQGRIALNYRGGVGNTSKFRYSLGITAVPALLSGTKASLGTSTNRSSFNLIPIARFEYLWSRQHKLSLNYSGNAVEPTFDQIQPVRDVSNPQNPIIGNPNLEATFTHSINTSYNNYITSSKLNYSANINATFTDNAVIRNTVQVREAYNSLINETRFTNINGVYRVNGNYNISKQLSDRKYNLALNGSVNYNHGISMSNNLVNTVDTWTFSERFGPRINPVEWLEINPNVAFNYSKSSNSLPTSVDSRTNITALNLEGKVYLWQSLIFGYNLSKNFVSGINANITNNPFIINLYAEKELFKRRGKVTLQAFDLLNQNNFVNRNITENSIVDTKSNALSRYFMVRLSMRLQKWTGKQPRGGGDLLRRNDGSFIN